MMYSGSATETARKHRGTERSHTPAAVLDDVHAAAPQAEQGTRSDEDCLSKPQPEPTAVLDDVYASAPPPELPKIVQVSLAGL